MFVVAIDLGGTKIELGLIAPDNVVLARKRIPAHTFDGVDVVIARMCEQIEMLKTHLPEGETLAAIGICAPGPLDHITGMLKDPPNIGLQHVPLGPLLSKATGLPVVLEHDAKAAALGEYHYGAGRWQKNMVYIVAGTGVGGAMIEHGQLIRGVQNTAGEIGHITLDRHGMVCSCGSRGCVQTYLAGPYLVARYKGKEQRGKLKEELTGEDIASLAKQGDSIAQEVMREAGETLGILVAILAVTLDSELFVLGGSVAKAGELILLPARETAPQYALSSIAPRIKIVPSGLGDDAPLLGCAYLARQFDKNVN